MTIPGYVTCQPAPNLTFSPSALRIPRAFYLNPGLQSALSPTLGIRDINHNIIESSSRAVRCRIRASLAICLGTDNSPDENDDNCRPSAPVRSTVSLLLCSLLAVWCSAAATPRICPGQSPSTEATKGCLSTTGHRHLEAARDDFTLRTAEDTSETTATVEHIGTSADSSFCPGRQSRTTAAYTYGSED